MRATLLLLLLAAPLAAQDRRSIQRGSPCEWDELFRAGCVSEPCGATRGTVLWAEGHCPKIKARIQGSAWKGKLFHGDGSFTNRWFGGIKALTECVSVGTSSFDGQPCTVMQYPAGTPIFGGLRDEVRQIAPGTWLGRCTDSATGCLKGYFLLQAK